MFDVQEITRSAATDDELVAGIRAGDLTLFEEVMRRHNQRLYRVARAIVKNDHEAEDVMQQAYIQAYLHIDRFAGRSRFSTWLTRIAIHEALMRRRKQQSDGRAFDDNQNAAADANIDTPNPERLAYAGELRALLESSIDSLPESYRLVFMCRDVEGLSTAETCEALGLGEEAVKTRLHRARAALRRELFARVGSNSAEAFTFHLSRCDAIVSAVLARIAQLRA